MLAAQPEYALVQLGYALVFCRVFLTLNLCRRTAKSLLTLFFSFLVLVLSKVGRDKIGHRYLGDKLRFVLDIMLEVTKVTAYADVS